MNRRQLFARLGTITATLLVPAAKAEAAPADTAGDSYGGMIFRDRRDDLGDVHLDSYWKGFDRGAGEVAQAYEEGRLDGYRIGVEHMTTAALESAHPPREEGY